MSHNCKRTIVSASQFKTFNAKSTPIYNGLRSNYPVSIETCKNMNNSMHSTILSGKFPRDEGTCNYVCIYQTGQQSVVQ